MFHRYPTEKLGRLYAVNDKLSGEQMISDLEGVQASAEAAQ